MIEFLLALLISIIIGIVTLNDELTASGLLQNALPAWMQGMGTVAGVILAWKAYQAWKFPENARRRADSALLIIRASQNVEHRLRDVMHDVLIFASGGTGSDSEQGFLELQKLPRKGPELRELKKAIEQLRNYRTEAKHLFGEEAAGLLNKLADGAEKARNAPEMLESFSLAMTFGEDEPKAMEVLGELAEWMGASVHLGDLFEDSKIVTIGGNSYREGLQKAGEELREQVVTSLTI